MPVLRNRLHWGNASFLWVVFFPEGCHRRGCCVRTKRETKRKHILQFVSKVTPPSMSTGLCPLGLRGSREANLLTTRFLPPREEAVKSALRFSVTRQPCLSSTQRDVEMANTHRLTSRGLRTFPQTQKRTRL